MKRTAAGTILAAAAGQRVRLQGWVHRRRDHGGISFFNLRDASGIVQVVVREVDQPAVAEILGPVRLEWVIEVEGVVAPRAAEALNPDMATGEIEVVADSAKILAPAEPLPFNPEGQEGVTEETRLRYRYLDLRRQALQESLRLRDRVVLEIRNYFHERSFVDLETPILTRSTPEGARDYLVPSREQRGSFYALPQSPQLFKQLLMVAGFERYVQIARCFRDEDLRSERQPEFTQVDVEMSFVEEEDVYELIEGLFARVFPLAGIEIRTPFRRLGYAEAMDRYGSDRPDLRYGLEIADLTAHVAESGFRAFSATAAEGGVVRGIAVPGAAGASRSRVDEWGELAKRSGALGVLTLKHGDDGLAFQVKNVLTESELEGLAADLGLQHGDMALIVAASKPVAAASLGALRVHLAREYDLVDAARHEFLWVTDFPLLEWDEASERFLALHHPFTSPALEDLALLESEPGAVRSRAYDIVLNGVELGGGSLRIHDPELQARVLGVLGIGREEAQSRFGFLLDALRYGAPPHGGIALGLDRMVMMMAGRDSIRDVIPFPKTTSAACLMTEAPSRVDAEQLRELGLSVTETED